MPIQIGPLVIVVAHITFHCTRARYIFLIILFINILIYIYIFIYLFIEIIITIESYSIQTFFVNFFLIKSFEPPQIVFIFIFFCFLPL